MSMGVVLVVTLLYIQALCDPDIPSRPISDRPVSLILSSEGAVTCTAGHYIHLVKNECVPCPPGSFLTAQMSEKKPEVCVPCMKPIAEINEIVDTPCTPQRDTHIMCRAGYFRDVDTIYFEPSCIKCTNCSKMGVYEARSCGRYNDTVCCRHDNMIVVNDTCVKNPASPTTKTAVKKTTNPGVENSRNNRHSSTMMVVDGNILQENTSPDNKQHTTKTLTDSTVTQSPHVTVGPNESTSPTKGPHHVPGLTVGLAVSTSTFVLVSALLGSALVYYIRKQKSSASLAVTGYDTYDTPDVDAHHYLTLGSPTTNQPQQIHVLSIQDPCAGDRSDYSVIPDYIEVH